jgi:cytochrome c554/c'-like protein
MRGPLRDGEHLIRVAGLFAVGLAAFLLAKHFLVPSGFGMYGHFRPGALADNRAHPVAYAGRSTCGDCHDDVAGALAAGQHARVGCEACHGPQARHAEDPSAGDAPPRLDPRAVCLGCHTANAAKPAKFPQIVPKDHAAEGACTECHAAHAPGSAPEASR